IISARRPSAGGAGGGGGAPKPRSFPPARSPRRAWRASAATPWCPRAAPAVVGERAGQALVLPAQPGVLPLHRINRRPAPGRTQRLERSPVALLAPLADQRGVQ